MIRERVKSLQLNLSERWDRQIGRRAHDVCRPLAALTYLAREELENDLIDAQKFIFVVLYDEAANRARPAVRLAGYGGRRIPWGLRWGGRGNNLFYKNLSLKPKPGAKGRRVDLAREELLRTGLELDSLIERKLDNPGFSKEDRIQLPQLWAAFSPAVEPALSGDGPELYGLVHELGSSAEDLMRESRRVHCGMVLYPLSWVSHHWEQMTAVFAELRDIPSQQVFKLNGPAETLCGYRGACEFDFFGNRFHGWNLNSPRKSVITIETNE